MIPPLFPDVDTRTYQGRYRVQLELPPESTLTPREIETVLAMASWEINPTTRATALEGSRAVLIGRERSIERAGVQLSGLQISGIGYIPFTISSNGLYCIKRAEFVPPSNKNFMTNLPEGVMGTSE